MDDAKVSHMEEEVVRNLIKDIKKEFGETKPTFANHHEYLGMKIVLTEDRKMTIDMRDQIKEISADFSEDISSEISMLVAKHLTMEDENAIL